MINGVREHVALVALFLPTRRSHGVHTRSEVDDNLDELAELVDTAGGRVVARILQTRASIDSAYFIGRGKAEELAWLARERDVHLFVFDDDLSPVQVRNLEKVIGRKIIDRSGIILDIFASRAKTSEAKTQVQLAQLQYMLPRLTRQWTHLSKQYGGIGTKGPGETQIETDRRAIRTKITRLREKLRQISQERAIQRKGREHLPRVGLVGYTNAGKSTLMRRLTGANVQVEDRLFATLDSTVRIVDFPTHHRMLLTDTVGFIRKLPHHLIASFKSTLDEVLEADLLLHVIDVSHPACDEHIGVVDETLLDIGVKGKPIIQVFNKIDLVRGGDALRGVSRRYPDAVFISASRGINIRSLQQRLIEIFDENVVEQTLTVGHDDQQIIARIHEVAEILEKEYDEFGMTIRYRIDRKLAGSINGIIGGKMNGEGGRKSRRQVRS